MPYPRASAIFAKRLKQGRERLGVSQRQLGDLLGLGKQVGSTRINRYEQQASLCDMETAARIARELGVPLAYLFAESDALAAIILAFAEMTKTEQTKMAAEMTEKVAKRKPKAAKTD